MHMKSGKEARRRMGNGAVHLVNPMCVLRKIVHAIHMLYMYHLSCFVAGKTREKRDDIRKNIVLVQNPKQSGTWLRSFARFMSQSFAGPRQSMEGENLARSVEERGRY